MLSQLVGIMLKSYLDVVFSILKIKKETHLVIIDYKCNPYLIQRLLSVCYSRLSSTHSGAIHTHVAYTNIQGNRALNTCLNQPRINTLCVPKYLRQRLLKKTKENWIIALTGENHKTRDLNGMEACLTG